MPKLNRDTRRTYTEQYRTRGTESVNASGDQSFYNSHTWRKFSTAYRKRYPLCEVATASGETKAADVVDHIIPISAGGAQFDERNLMPMSHYYHNRKRGYERHGIDNKIQSIDTATGKVPVDREQVYNLLLKQKSEEGEGGVDL